MDYISWLKMCIKHRLSIDQLMFLVMLRMKDFQDPKSLANQYLSKVGTFSTESVLQPLIKKDLVINLNTKGKYLPEFIVITEKGDKLFATYEMGEEFWESYPGTLPLSNGSEFMARAGIDKDDLIDLYLNRIRHDPQNHTRVMRALEKYVKRVRAGLVNGHKIKDFVSQELWTNIDKDDEPEQTWGHDV